MNNLTEEELNILKNQFEIEERVIKQLKYREDIEYYNNNIRRTTSNQFNQEERLRTTTARERHWNKLATDITCKFFTNDRIINSSMTQDITESDILKIARLMKEVVSLSAAAKSKDDGLDFLERPTKYDGSRDPHAIESWIQSVEDYGGLKDFDDTKMAKLGVALLTGASKVWYQNLRLLDSAPSDWLHFKMELRAFSNWTIPFPWLAIGCVLYANHQLLPYMFRSL